MRQPKNTRTRRMLRTLGFTRNPLCRRTDRIEAALRVVAACLLVLTTVAGAGLGLVSYRHAAAHVATQRRALLQVPAVLLADVPTLGNNPDGAIAASVVGVRARWTLPSGSTRTGTVYVESTGAKGETVTVWMDAAYRPKPPPATLIELASRATLIAFTVWLLAMLGLVLGYHLADLRLHRQRDTAWTRDWLRVERQWRHSV